MSVGGYPNFLKEGRSSDPLTLVSRPDIYLDLSDTNPCYMLPQHIGIVSISA